METFRELALGYENATEEPHFEKVSYRLKNKIFATLDLQARTAVVKLTLEQQAAVLEEHPDSSLPVKGAWGKKGWTSIDLNLISQQSMAQLLRLAYFNVKG
ncbi:MAG: hypothetical protein RL266_1403 [Bacteroidota bacterium]